MLWPTLVTEVVERATRAKGIASPISAPYSSNTQSNGHNQDAKDQDAKGERKLDGNADKPIHDRCGDDRDANTKYDRRITWQFHRSLPLLHISCGA